MDVDQLGRLGFCSLKKKLKREYKLQKLIEKEAESSFASEK